MIGGPTQPKDLVAEEVEVKPPLELDEKVGATEVYIDDIAQPTLTALQNLDLFTQTVLACLRSGFRLSLRKSFVMAKRLVILGWAISRFGRSIDDAKRMKLADWKDPTCAAELNSAICYTQWLADVQPFLHNIVEDLKPFVRTKNRRPFSEFAGD